MSDALTLLFAASLRATAVLAGAWVISLLLRRSSASARHGVWACALGVAVLTPVLLQIPIRGVPIPTAIAQWSPSMAIPVRDDGATIEPAAIDVDLSSLAMAPTSVTEAAAMPSPAIYIAWLWVAGFAAVLLYAFMSMTATSRVRRAAARLDAPWIDEARVLAGTVGARRVAFAESTDSPLPFVCGIVKTLVVMPDTVSSWDAERRRVVLLHELAHVTRRDCVTQLMAQIACALYWFHPLSWFAMHRLRVEREQACDDFVLAAGVRGSAYAHHLVDVARHALPCRSLLTATRVAIAHRSQLEDRVIAILDPTTRRTTPRLTRVATLVFAICALGIASLRVQASSSSPVVSPATVSAPSSRNQPQTPPSEPGARTESPVAIIANASVRPAVQQAGPPPLPALPATDARLLVLSFGLGTMQPDEARRATATGVRFVNERMTNADSLAVVTIGTRLSVVKDFTSSREELKATLESPGLLNDTAPDVGALASNPISQAVDAAAFANARLHALTTLCQTLRPLQQKKAVIYFSSDVKSMAGLPAELRALTNACVRADVSIYTVDMRGLQAVTPTSPIARLQQPSLRFDAVSIKRNTISDFRLGFPRFQGDTFTARQVWVQLLVATAYGVAARDVIGPGWTAESSSEKFDIEAKAREGTTPQERQAMLRDLLATRFALRVRQETREMPAYVLTTVDERGELGPNLRRSTADCTRGECKGGVTRGAATYRGAQWSSVLQAIAMGVEERVIDRTGLSGAFDVELTFGRALSAQPGDPPDIFTAVRHQLGLKLELTRVPVELTVIESVERPTPN